MDNYSILVVEDDEEISSLIGICLRKQGYNVYQAYDGKEALYKYSERNYHLVVLDIMLPGIDGLELLRRIREKSNIPVLILSAKGEETDKVIGLGMGADDYMQKPFSMAELTARVKAQLRRYLYFNIREGAEDIVEAGELRLNTRTYEVLRDGQAVALTAKEFEILKLLMAEPNRVFTKAHIFRLIWGEDYISDDNTVMVHIRRLREKIEENPSEPQYIHTVWGIGYKFGEVKK